MHFARSGSFLSQGISASCARRIYIRHFVLVYSSATHSCSLSHPFSHFLTRFLTPGHFVNVGRPANRLPDTRRHFTAGCIALTPSLGQNDVNCSKQNYYTRKTKHCSFHNVFSKIAAHWVSVACSNIVKSFSRPPCCSVSCHNQRGKNLKPVFFYFFSALQVHSDDFFWQPEQTPFSMGLPHFSHGEHPHV